MAHTLSIELSWTGLTHLELLCRSRQEVTITWEKKKRVGGRRTVTEMRKTNNTRSFANETATKTFEATQLNFTLFWFYLKALLLPNELLNILSWELKNELLISKYTEG